MRRRDTISNFPSGVSGSCIPVSRRFWSRRGDGVKKFVRDTLNFIKKKNTSYFLNLVLLNFFIHEKQLAGKALRYKRTSVVNRGGVHLGCFKLRNPFDSWPGSVGHERVRGQLLP
jgi:hypothetical protein